MAPNTISTRLMVISDTHEYSLDGTTMPGVDVLIHTGDLTNFGELDSLRECVRMLGTITAELKLVIAGNHDISLDPIRRVENMSDEEYAAYHASALEIMTGAEAKAAGIMYLQEGTHIFTLRNGTSFKVYASPCTPGTGGWAFPYAAHEDQFLNAIKKGVDIVMTHGPPFSVLDQVDGQSLGCPSLLRAVSRSKPLMHCFGHIHEGHAQHIVTWKPDGTIKNPAAATPLETEQFNEYPYANEWVVRRGQQTLMVNAAIMMNTSRGMKPNYKPCIVALDLPRK